MGAPPLQTLFAIFGLLLAILDFAGSERVPSVPNGLVFLISEPNHLILHIYLPEMLKCNLADFVVCKVDPI